jgi:hypothetical protein
MGGGEVEGGWGFDVVTCADRNVPPDSRPGRADSYGYAFRAFVLDAVVNDVVTDEESTPPHSRLW